jgi:long-subunit acyl-CoA synthetase (AMP-forming)
MALPANAPVAEHHQRHLVAMMQMPDPAGGRTQALGAIGEVLPRGYQLMVGYFELTEPTATAIDGGGGTPVTWAR